VYGSCIDTSRSSFDKPRPDNTYGFDKLDVERYAERQFKRSSKAYFILRMGHVYGPGQNVTKQIFQNTRNGEFKLPFDGQLPSNAISSLSICEAVQAMLLAPGNDGVFNLADDPMLSWREMYDLHTNSWGLPTVDPMSDDRSSGRRDALHWASRKGLFSSLKSLASRVKGDTLLAMSRDHNIRTSIDKMRASFPQGLESRSRAGHLACSVSRDIQSLNSATPQPPDRLFSDPMPGPYFQIPKSQISSNIERLPGLLNEWHTAVPSYKWRPEEFETHKAIKVENRVSDN
jgi:hypothetical protein